MPAFIKLKFYLHCDIYTYLSMNLDLFKEKNSDNSKCTIKKM